MPLNTLIMVSSADTKNVLKFCVTDGYGQANRLYRTGIKIKRISILTCRSIGRTDRICRELENGSYVVINFAFRIVGSIIGLLSC